MIRQIHIQNYKALRDVTLDLTPFHVLIGPNDSGKTSILRATELLCHSVDDDLKDCVLGESNGSELIWSGSKDRYLSFGCAIGAESTECRYTLKCELGRQGQVPLFFVQLDDLRGQRTTPFLQVPDDFGVRTSVQRKTTGGVTSPFSPFVSVAERAFDALSGARYYRFNPQRLALPVARNSDRRFAMERSGFGLALCLDDIRDESKKSYDEIEQRLRSIFPQISSIQFKPKSAAATEPGVLTQMGMQPQGGWGKELFFEFSGSLVSIPASQVSDGILLVLAYLTILNLPQPPRVILVEEPETGIYPKLLREVVKILRDLINGQSHSQVIMTTHSPYVLDEFTPEEVSLCKKNSDGSVSIHPVSKNQSVKDQLDVFSLGELWTGEIDADAAGSGVAAGEPAK